MAKTTVIVPRHNAGGDIAELARQVRKAMPDAAILLIEDSPDNDSARAAGEAGCQVIRTKGQRDFSEAVVEAIRSSQNADIIVVADGDFEHSAKALPKMARELEHNDLVVGSRLVTDASAPETVRPRPLVTRIASLLAWPLAPHIKDRTSNFLGFHTKTVNPAVLDPGAWNIGLEVIARGKYTKAAEVPYASVAQGKNGSGGSGRDAFASLRQVASLYMSKFQILNFMVVGGIGYFINIGAYSLLLRVAKFAETTFLGQHFYLPPFAISSLLAIVSNYELNKLWTFKGWNEQSMGFLRYLSMALVTLMFDMAGLWILVDWGKITPIFAAALAIAMVFIIRYFVAKKWIWSKKSISP